MARFASNYNEASVNATSSTYSSLGLSITLNNVRAGAKAIVSFRGRTVGANSANGNLSFAVSGANTIPASEENSTANTNANNTYAQNGMAIVELPNAGNNTFTLWGRSFGNSTTIGVSFRGISVLVF